MTDLTRKQIETLRALRDGCNYMSCLSKRLGISPSGALARVRRLESIALGLAYTSRTTESGRVMITAYLGRDGRKAIVKGDALEARLAARAAARKLRATPPTAEEVKAQEERRGEILREIGEQLAKRFQTA